MNLESFNALSPDEMKMELMACCHCDPWAERVMAYRPFQTFDELVTACRGAWLSATEEEILSAFSGHPQIGDLEALKNRYAETASAEQGQVAGADEEVLIRLRDRNQEYLEKFGFIFIVCASGKSAEAMLALLENRLDHSRDRELAIGAREQGAITELRLAKLFEE